MDVRFAGCHYPGASLEPVLEFGNTLATLETSSSKALWRGMIISNSAILPFQFALSGECCLVPAICYFIHTKI